MGAFGESPPLATPTTGAWLVALVLLPWPVAALLQRLIPSISRREAALVAYNLAAISPNIYMAYVGCYTYWADEGAAAGGIGVSLACTSGDPATPPPSVESEQRKPNFTTEVEG